jgi:hypothetical protein
MVAAGTILEDVIPRVETGASRGREAGRRATACALRACLSSASAEFLRGAVDNPQLGEAEIVLLVRNRRCPPDLLARIAGEPRWLPVRPLQRALVRHPSLPLAVARSVLTRLGWTDLADLAGQSRVVPALRRAAHEGLRARLAELELGERTALARRAGRDLIPALAPGREARVLQSLLSNPNLCEPDAVGFASDPSTPREVLELLSAHHRWSVRPAVRYALVVNRRAPVPAALRLLRTLEPRQLRSVVNNDRVSPLVRIGAERRLAEPTLPASGQASRSRHG